MDQGDRPKRFAMHSAITGLQLDQVGKSCLIINYKMNSNIFVTHNSVKTVVEVTF